MEQTDEKEELVFCGMYYNNGWQSSKLHVDVVGASTQTIVKKTRDVLDQQPSAHPGKKKKIDTYTQTKFAGTMPSVSLYSGAEMEGNSEIYS